jgi:uncharacterized lipoprotein YajG
MFLLSRNSKLIAFSIVVMSVLIVGCATPGGEGPGKTLSLNPDYKYKIKQITVSDAAKFEIEPAELLQTALEESLREKGLLLDDDSVKQYYFISARILDYEMGNAFKRWLMPGYGSTVLGVHTDVIDSETGETLTYMEHRQTTAAGGLYSVGAWESIFTSVANDITTDIERKYTGGDSGFFINLSPWLEKEEKGPDTKQSQQIKLVAFNDKRKERNRIGERHAAFNVSMGDIYTNRDVASFITEAVQNELLASGNKLTDNPNDITVSGDVIKFWIWTDTTALYWDIIGEIEVNLNVVSPKSDKSHQKLYKAKSTKRTYVYPSQELVEEVVSETIKNLMLDIRQDSPWITLQ